MWSSAAGFFCLVYLVAGINSGVFCLLVNFCVSVCVFFFFFFFPLLTLSKFSKFKVTYLKQLITNNIHFTAEFRFTILELIVMT